MTPNGDNYTDLIGPSCLGTIHPFQNLLLQWAGWFSHCLEIGHAEQRYCTGIFNPVDAMSEAYGIFKRVLMECHFLQPFPRLAAAQQQVYGLIHKMRTCSPRFGAERREAEIIG